MNCRKLSANPSELPPSEFTPNTTGLKLKLCPAASFTKGACRTISTAPSRWFSATGKVLATKPSTPTNRGCPSPPRNNSSLTADVSIRAYRIVNG
ncbi:MAG: hypothetical protein PHH93_00045 [Prolixibacteraceae bacterium]|nr:hypothetical protein [Prolixibacteraceae bacterium]